MLLNDILMTCPPNIADFFKSFLCILEEYINSQRSSVHISVKMFKINGYNIKINLSAVNQSRFINLNKILCDLDLYL